jgi:hypothetical protein
MLRVRKGPPDDFKICESDQQVAEHDILVSRVNGTKRSEWMRMAYLLVGTERETPKGGSSTAEIPYQCVPEAVKYHISIRHPRLV